MSKQSFRHWAARGRRDMHRRDFPLWERALSWVVLAVLVVIILKAILG